MWSIWCNLDARPEELARQFEPTAQSISTWVKQAKWPPPLKPKKGKRHARPGRRRRPRLDSLIKEIPVAMVVTHNGHGQDIRARPMWRIRLKRKVQSILLPTLIRPKLRKWRAATQFASPDPEQ
jgi:hypothetical protein